MEVLWLFAHLATSATVKQMQLLEGRLIPLLEVLEVGGEASLHLPIIRFPTALIFPAFSVLLSLCPRCCFLSLTSTFSLPSVSLHSAK